MADSLGALQAYGSPDIASLVELISGNIDHVYDINKHVTNSTLTVKTTSFNSEYSAYLVWFKMYTSGSTYAGFTVAKAGSTIYFTTGGYLKLNTSDATTQMNSNQYADITVLGIL